MDREKVIKGIERCLVCDPSVIASDEGQKAYLDCEYTVGLYCDRKRLLLDALALLKEQDAVVRCADCRWFVDGICEKYGFQHPQDWFCEDGDRR